jgi:hypothetical protein
LLVAVMPLVPVAIKSPPVVLPTALAGFPRNHRFP